MPRNDDTKPVRLLVALALSRSKWGMAAAVRGQPASGSASIEVSRHRRDAKSDGVDADQLVELMQRKSRGEARALRKAPERRGRFNRLQIP
jgi:hypothetical protein